jgi:hypothetical protein
MQLQTAHIKAALVGGAIGLAAISFSYVVLSAWLLLQSLHSSLISALP